jgi:hypothetical protein
VSGFLGKDMETGKSTVFEDAQDRPIVTLVQVGSYRTGEDK